MTADVIPFPGADPFVIMFGAAAAAKMRAEIRADPWTPEQLERARTVALEVAPIIAELNAQLQP